MLPPRQALRRARRAAGRVAFLLALVAFPLDSHAEPLPKEACDLLADEQARLTAVGAKDWMAQGAANRSRFTGEQLKQIQRFIEVDELLIFRCGLFKARYMLPRDPEEPAEEPPAKAPRKPEGKLAKGKAKAKQEPPAAVAGESAPGAKAPGFEAKQAGRRKQKPDDAFRPPETRVTN